MEDLLCIGHCCHDKTPGGWTLGGTVSYASVIAKRMGMDPVVLTSVGDDFMFYEHFQEAGIPVHNIPSEKTTVFENVYHNEYRTQYLHARGSGITPKEIPDILLRIPMVLLAPIADEIDIHIAALFGDSFVASTIQGFLRKWDSSGVVRSSGMDWEKLSLLDLVILSDDDINGMEECLQDIREHAGHVVVTKGSKGVRVFHSDKEYFFHSFPTEVVDATGAGDVFAIAYILEFQRTTSVRKACIFAHCAASLIIECKGLSRMPSISEINDRVSAYRQLFPEYDHQPSRGST